MEQIDLQFLKASGAMSFMFSGIVIEVSDLQPSKTDSSIFSTLFGIVIDTNAEQDLKAHSAIKRVFALILKLPMSFLFTLTKQLSIYKAPSSQLSGLLYIAVFLKTSPPIHVILLGMLMDLSEEQFSKAL